MSYLIDTFSSLANCEECTLKGSKLVHSLFLGDEEFVDILVIGQSPGAEEVKMNRPFIGSSGRLVFSVLNNYSKKVGLVNLISCRPIDEGFETDRAPKSIEIKCCRDRFKSDVLNFVENCHPRIVIVFGAPAKKEIQRMQTNEMKDIKVPVFFFDHPAYVLRNKEFIPRWETELHSCLKSVFGSIDSEKFIEDTFISFVDELEPAFINDCKNSKLIGVDLETNGLNTFASTFKIGTCAVSCDTKTYFFDFRNSDIEKQKCLLEILKDSSIQKVFANILYDVVALEYANIKVNNYSDVLPLAYMFDNIHKEYSLEALVMRYFPEYASYKQKFKLQLIDNNFLASPIRELKIYNCMDAFMTKTIYSYLLSVIGETEKKAFNGIILRLLPVLILTKLTGMRIDVNLLDEYEKIFIDRVNVIKSYFKTKHNVENVNSVPQIRKWLFEKNKMKPIKDTKSGAPTTDKTALRYYAKQLPDVNFLYEARRIESLLNYFIPSIRNNLVGDIIHPNYKHFGIASFRISCQAPNLQGIPRTSTGIEVLDKYPLRGLFISRSSDSYLVEFDFSQQEVRLVAEFSGDQNLIRAFNENLDVHKFVASLIFSKPIEAISKFERQVAKGCVFGAIFGVSSKELAIDLNTSDKQAQHYIDSFFARFPRVKKYIDDKGNLAVDKRVIYSKFGMPRKFLQSDKTSINDIKREAANHTIQNPAACLTFLSLIKICQVLKECELLNSDVFLIHTVHDSILLDIKRVHLPFVIETCINIMQSIPSNLGFKVPFLAEYKIGHRWSEDLKLDEQLQLQSV